MHPLIEDVRTRLADAADPAKAGPMQAYMKSAMPYRGVQAPGVKVICRDVFAAHRIEDRPTWERVTRELFDDAAYREERYAAIALTGHRFYREWQDFDTLALYDHLVVTGAWWDFVDEIASRRVGPILRADPERVRPLLLTWAHDDHLWRRRTAIIAQIQFKDATDADLLAACIEPSLPSKEADGGSGVSGQEFFLRKGIGWALRAYARTEPAWVRSYVESHPELSPLSKREALKHL